MTTSTLARLAGLAATAGIAAALGTAPAAAQKPEMEKCYGIAKAGKNDCASAGNNSCGGTARRDADPAAWGYVPVGMCERITGGSMTPKKA